MVSFHQFTGLQSAYCKMQYAAFLNDQVCLVTSGLYVYTVMSFLVRNLHQKNKNNECSFKSTYSLCISKGVTVILNTTDAIALIMMTIQQCEKKQIFMEVQAIIYNHCNETSLISKFGNFVLKKNEAYSMAQLSEVS